MLDDDIKLLLVKYITNQADEAGEEEVKRWVKLHPENELYYIELYEAWQNMLYLKTEVIDEDKAYQLFAEKLAPVMPVNYGRRWLKVAATVIILVSSLLIVYLRTARHENNHQVIAQNGSIKKIVLTDGTIVWLNAGSSVKYDADFNKTNRTVYLEGEAFFDIGHPVTEIPFLVKTKNYTIRDIGTSFNLKAYPTDLFFEAIVIKGEVDVENNADAGLRNVNRIFVKPHQVLKIFYHPEKAGTKGKMQLPETYNEVRVSQVDSAKIDVYDGWKDDLLLFDGSSLDDIARVLERRYNVTIQINSPELHQIRYSGSFRNIPDIETVLHLISQNTPISYNIEGQKITITKIN